jgi:hypothetical protein
MATSGAFEHAPKYHTQKMQGRRKNLSITSAPRARTSTSSSSRQCSRPRPEVLHGLRKAFRDYEQRNERLAIEDQPHKISGTYPRGRLSERGVTTRRILSFAQGSARW